MALSHAELNQRAVQWLLSHGCYAVLSELKTWGTGEIPDAIGWKSSYSILIESKTSRADFMADRDKYWRKNPEKGVGNYRLFLAEPGIILPDALPKGWGLLEIAGRKIRRRVFPVRFWGEGCEFRQVANADGERGLLSSALMRLGNQHTNIAGKVFWKKCSQFYSEQPSKRS